MKIEYDTSQYIKKLNSADSYFKTFINKKSLASGVLLLKPNEEDTQEPHESDEIYYVINGNGFLQIKKKSYSVKEGNIYFVAKNFPHHFYGNTEDLLVLYFFGGSD